MAIGSKLAHHLYFFLYIREAKADAEIQFIPSHSSIQFKAFKMNKFVTTNFLVGLVCVFGQGSPGSDEIIIQAPDVTPYGKWGRWDNCTEGRVVTSFQVKVN